MTDKTVAAVIDVQAQLLDDNPNHVPPGIKPNPALARLKINY